LVLYVCVLIEVKFEPGFCLFSGTTNWDIFRARVNYFILTFVQANYDSCYEKGEQWKEKKEEGDKRVER